MSNSKRGKQKLDPKEQARLLGIARRETGLHHLKLTGYRPDGQDHSSVVHVVSGNHRHIGYFKDVGFGGGETFAEEHGRAIRRARHNDKRR